MSIAYLPEGTAMGRLEIINVYINYDGPRLFSCRNDFDVRFFGVFADEDDFADRYLFAAADQTRFREVEAGHVPLWEAFNNPSWGQLFVYEVTPGGSTSLEAVDPLNVDPDWFPDAEARLSVATETQRKLVEELT
jgi:hypothetical protein